MCITFLGWGLHQKTKFFLLFNREEFFKRETFSLGFHSKDPNFKDKLFYPLDCISDGTFFCLNVENGLFCVLLNNNFEENPYNPNVKYKRGEIAIGFCKTSGDFEEFFKALEENKYEYNGFNIICGNMKSGEFAYYTNNTKEGELIPLKLPKKQICGVSNSFILGESVYNNKVEHGKKLISQIIEEDQEKEGIDIWKLLRIMQDETKLAEANYSQMPASILLNKDMKHYLSSSIFVNHKINDDNHEYGTRHTICLTLDINEKLSIFEFCDDIYQHEDKFHVRKRNETQLKEHIFQL